MIFFFHLLLPALLIGTAVSTNTSDSTYRMTETDEASRYHLTIRLDAPRGPEMRACIARLTDTELDGAPDENIVAEHGDIRLTYLAHRSMIVLATQSASRESAEQAHRMGEELKTCLALPTGQE